MDVSKLLASLRDCECGHAHESELKAVECDSGNVRRAGELLAKYDFPKHILLVADENTIAAAEGVEGSLSRAGYRFEEKLYKDLRVADMVQVKEIEALIEQTGADGVLSVGTGSLNDICRLSTFRMDKAFSIFATAPSMDGFASGSTPITEDNFKVSYTARQPSVIITDTQILASSPQVLKSAGFGDMIAKYIGLVDWQVSNITTGEYLCPRIFELTREALMRIVALADKITQSDEEAAAAVFESLVLTGVAMRAAGCSRPGSGTEHVVSHFWECKKLEQGHISDFHGKKCGVATVLVNRVYHDMIEREIVEPHNEKLDWDDIRAAYGPRLAPEMMKYNLPTTVTDETTPEILKEAWPKIRRIVKEQLPSDAELLSLMKRAGCATTIEEIGVSPELGAQGLKYHPFMRRRMTLMRLRNMLGFEL